MQEGVAQLGYALPLPSWHWATEGAQDGSLLQLSAYGGRFAQKILCAPQYGRRCQIISGKSSTNVVKVARGAVLKHEEYECACAVYRGSRESTYIFHETSAELASWVEYINLDQLMSVGSTLAAS